MDLDDDDNCPLIVNPDQTDNDGDGDLDDDDNCPLVANSDQADIDDDNIGDVCDDSDGDGHIDAEDNCPNIGNGNQRDTDGDGDGDLCDDDDDDDGILDDGDNSGTIGDNPCDDAVTTNCDDNCQFAPNPEQDDLDQDGLGEPCDPDTTRLTVLPTDATCTYAPPVGDFSPTVEWSYSITSNDPYPAKKQVMMTPVVANLTDDNGDGVIDTRDIPDILFASFDTNLVPSYDNLRGGVLRAVNGDGSGLIFSVGNAEIGEYIQGAGNIAVADIDGDGKVEIVVGAETGGLIAFENDGTLKWRSTHGGGSFPSPFVFWCNGRSIGDLDGDGNVEIVVGAAAFDHDGNFLFDGKDSLDLVNAGGQGINRSGSTTYTGTLSVLADLDWERNGQGQWDLEIVTGRTAYTADGNILWEARADLEDGFPAIADFDDDGHPEVVVSSVGTLRVHDGYTGALVWGPLLIDLDGVNGGDGRIGAPTIADFNGDGDPEVGVASKNGYLAIDIDLSNPNATLVDALLWDVATQDSSSSMTGSSVFDFEGDGKAEVVYNDELFLRVFDGTTGEVLYEQPNTSYTALEYPIIVDVDNDGQAEIVVAANDFECGDILTCTSTFSGIRVFGDAADNWVSTRRIWNQHSYHITNVDEDGTIPVQEDDSTLTHNTYRLNALIGVDAQAGPDLMPGELGGFGEGCRFELSAWVENRGASRVGANLAVAFYGVSNGNTLLLGVGRTSLPLEPGNAERVSIISTPTDGAYDVYVVVDDDGTGTGFENECDEDNNTGATVADLLTCP